MSFYFIILFTHTCKYVFTLGNFLRTKLESRADLVQLDQPPLFQTKSFSSALIFTETSGYCSRGTQNIAPPLIIPSRARRPTERTLSAHIYAISLSAHTLTVAFGSWNLILLAFFRM